MLFGMLLVSVQKQYITVFVVFWIEFLPTLLLIKGLIKHSSGSRQFIRFTELSAFLKTKRRTMALELGFRWDWEEHRSCSVGLVAQCVGGRPWGERIYTGETRIIGIQFQDQGVMTPLLGRASGEGLRDWLPTLDSHQLSSQHTKPPSHTCAYTSSYGIWAGLITSWDLGLQARPGPGHWSDLGSVSVSQSVSICVCVSSCLSGSLPSSLYSLFLCYTQSTMFCIQWKTQSFSQKITAVAE